MQVFANRWICAFLKHKRKIALINGAVSKVGYFFDSFLDGFFQPLIFAAENKYYIFM